MTDTTGAAEISIHVKEQNLERNFHNSSEFAEWLKEQAEYWPQWQSVFNERLDLGNLGNFEIGRYIQDIANQWRNWAQQAHDQQKVRSLAEQIQNLSKNLELLIPAGALGEQLEKLKGRDQRTVSCITIIAFNSCIIKQDRILGGLTAFARAMIITHPIMNAMRDIASAARAEQVSTQTAAEIENDRRNFDQWLKNQKRAISILADRFRKELPFEKPAEQWSKAATLNQSRFQGYLVLFLLAIFAPALSIWFSSDRILEFLARIVMNGGGGVPFGTIALILVPSVAYGWFLKHISRLFVQSYALHVDAEHRRSLAITYLGLVDYEKTNLAETERAIILNALFRPPPPYSSDDGPPMGLIDLIKK